MRSQCTQVRQREEVLNSITHGLGFGLAVAVLTILIVQASIRGDAWTVVGVSIYGATLVLLYLSSTLLHGFWHTRMSRFLQAADHSAIYLLIAGSYTPFMLTALRGGWGWSIFGAVWGLALLGISFSIFSKREFSNAASLVYLAMGWLIVIAIVPATLLLPHTALWLLFAGGLSYSLGVLFFLSTKPFRHTCWHLAVLAGSACHAIAVFMILPR